VLGIGGTAVRAKQFQPPFFIFTLLLFSVLGSLGLTFGKRQLTLFDLVFVFGGFSIPVVQGQTCKPSDVWFGRVIYRAFP
jgi:hypothetical protein